MLNLNRLPILAVCLGLASGGLFAATPEETETSLNAVRETLARSNAKVSEITSALAEALKAQGEISTRLVALGQNIQNQKSALAVVEEKIAFLQNRSITLQSDLSQKQNELSALLSGLIHLKTNPPPAIVVTPADALSAVRGAMVFGAVVPEVEARRKNLKEKLEELRLRDEQKRMQEVMSGNASPSG